MPDKSETPVTPWPSWLADSPPENKVRKIVEAVAECYGDSSCRGSGWHEPGGQQQPHCTAHPAGDLLLRLLDEAGAGIEGDAPSGHRYLSTACLHASEPGRENLHGYCQGGQGSNHQGETWVKTGGVCKFCESECRCPCHESAPRESPGWQGGDGDHAGAVRAAQESAGPGVRVYRHAGGLCYHPERESRSETPVSAVPPEPPLPPGEWARVEIMGHDSEYGWVTERTRAGVQVLVVSDWDGRVKAEIPGQSLYKFVPLPTPRNRPAVRGTYVLMPPDGDPDDTDGDYGWGDDGDDDGD
jgi:hypothetical protein